MEDRWISPVTRSGELSVEDILQWRTQGYALIDGLLPDALIAQASEEMCAAWPKNGTPQSEDFGSNGKTTFPCPFPALNDVVLHPNLLRAVGQLLGVSSKDLRLTQADGWPKYDNGADPLKNKPLSNRDQRIHCDFPNHTLLVPPDWDRPEAVEIILYYDEVELCGGPTAVVPRESDTDPAYAGWPNPLFQMPGSGAIPWYNDRRFVEEYLSKEFPQVYRFREELYRREKFTKYKKGTILFYRHDTWHRGTPLLSGASRRAHNLTFKLASSDWIPNWNGGWTRQMYEPDQYFEQLIARATVDQRNVLGFPHPGHAYWTPKTIAAVGLRYGCFGMDMKPYENPSL